jgi:anti-sigma B factor antagonist
MRKAGFGELVTYVSSDPVSKPAAIGGVVVRLSAGAADETVLRLSGELELHNARVLDEAVASAQARGTRRVVLDLAELSFMDSTGLRHLLRARRELGESGQAMHVVNATAAVRELLALTGLTSLLA